MILYQAVQTGDHEMNELAEFNEATNCCLHLNGKWI
jgi:hypothetical protein